MAHDAAHRVWLISSLAVNVEPEAVVVGGFPDGRRWSAPVTVAEGHPGQRLDKNWIVCDNTVRRARSTGTATRSGTTTGRETAWR